MYNELCTIKFLKENLDTYKYPRQTDIQKIQNKYVFNGTIPILSAGPFKITRHKCVTINKKFKELHKS